MKVQATAALEEGSSGSAASGERRRAGRGFAAGCGRKVYAASTLHIAKEEQRPLAYKLQGLLRDKGWIVPRIQNVGKTKATIPDRPEVRHIFPEDKSTAEQAMQFLNQVGISNARVESGSRSSSDRPVHVEIWFSNK